RRQPAAISRVGQESDRTASGRVQRCHAVDHDFAVAGQLRAAALGQLTQRNPRGARSHTQARRMFAVYLSASALMTLSVMSMRVLANTTGSCRIRSNFSDSAIC